MPREASGPDLEPIEPTKVPTPESPVDEGDPPSAPLPLPRSRSQVVVLVGVLAAVAIVVASAVVRTVQDGAGSEGDQGGDADTPLTSAESPGADAALGFGATVLVGGDGEVDVVDLETGEHQTVSEDGATIADDADGVTVVRDRDGRIWSVDLPDAESPTEIAADQAFVTASGHRWTIVDGAASLDDAEPVPLPAGTTAVAATPEQLVLRRGGAVSGWRPEGGWTVALPGATPRVLDAERDWIAWTDDACSSKCRIAVTDLGSGTTGWIVPDRDVVSASIAPSGRHIAVVADDGAIAFVLAADLGGGTDTSQAIEWFTFGSAPTSPFVWRIDASRGFVAVEDPPRVVELDPSGGPVHEVAAPFAVQTMAWLGPSSLGGPVAHSLGDFPSFEGDHPPLPAGEETGIQIGWVDPAGAARSLDVDSGLSGRLEPASSLPVLGIDGLSGGWLAGGQDGSVWYPDDGQPVRTTAVVTFPLGDERFLLAGTRDDGYLVRFDGSPRMEVEHFDLPRGELGDPFPVFLYPIASAAGGLIFEAPPSIHEPSPGVTWFDPGTGTTREIVAPSVDATFLAGAASDSFLWARGCERLTCHLVVADPDGVVVTSLDDVAVRRDFIAAPDVTSQISWDGRWFFGNVGGEPTLVALDGSGRWPIEGQAIVRVGGWSESGWAVYTDGFDTMYVLRPGDTAGQPIGEFAGSYAVR